MADVQALTAELTELRRDLHRRAEVSGNERETARAVGDYLTRAAPPDELLQGVGGTGLIAVYRGQQAGPTVVARCELDALPIPEAVDLPHASATPGVAHKCGHDGHMATAAGLGRLLAERRPPRGAVALLFQPAEEDGRGAPAVLADPVFSALAPQAIVALHNLPGVPLGQVVVRDGAFAAASTGVIIELQGATAHAAEPASGRSPALAMAHLVEALSALPQLHTRLEEAAQATVIHARLGEVAFGTSPGVATVMATLRAHHDAVLDTLARRAEALARGAAAAHELAYTFRHTETFAATVNAPDVVAVIGEVAQKLGLKRVTPDTPFPWSEDFGHFTAALPGALFGLGAGVDQPPLHAPGYDFPDALIPDGVRMLHGVVLRLIETQTGAAR